MGAVSWGRTSIIRCWFLLFAQKDAPVEFLLFFLRPNDLDPFLSKALGQILRGAPVGDEGVDLVGRGDLDQGVVAVLGVIHQDKLLLGDGKDPAL